MSKAYDQQTKVSQEALADQNKECYNAILLTHFLLYFIESIQNTSYNIIRPRYSKCSVQLQISFNLENEAKDKEIFLTVLFFEKNIFAFDYLLLRYIVIKLFDA